MKTIKKPNLNGPRFRESRISVLKADTLKEFKKKYPQYADLKLADFKNIVMTFNGMLAQGAIDNRNGVELPDGLGFVFLGSCEPSKSKNINYQRSHEYGVEATHRNWDSDNKLLKIFYTNYNAKYPFQNKQIWAFKACKEFRCNASVAYKENYSKYIEVPSKQKISSMFDRHRTKELMRNLKPVIPEGYDEFKL